ncbi:MAG TPA: response regulator [Chloroflexota bacterium]|nr:response regulator [Chloroflexota bacterium]
MVSCEAALRALTRATALVAEGLAEDRLLPLLARCASDAAGAELAAIYVRPNPPTSGKAAWRLSGYSGGDPEVLATLPRSYGDGGGVLAPLFQGAHEVHESDLLDTADDDAVPPRQFPVRSLVGLPVRRRDSRPVGVLFLGAPRRAAFDAPSLSVIRAMGQLVGIGIDNARLAAGQQSERRKAADSAVTLGTVLESVDSGVCVIELDGTVRVANKAFQVLFGTAGPGVNLSQADFLATAAIAPRESEAFFARLRELLADPAQIDESEWELATEPPRILQRYSAPMRSMVGEVVGRVDIYTDITQARRLYTQLLNSEKLRAIGEMASGVAHDFNNVLASIVGQTELLHLDDQPATTRLAINTIHQAALDGARMVRNLQGLARPRAETASTAAALNETVQLAVEMARPRWAGAALQGRVRIDVQLNLAESSTLGRVAIDPAELREVLLNLLFNATDAMPEGGRIEISTRPGDKPGTADLEVRDTGSGMPESVRAHIFEPFFSTKGPKGSGLGLAVAYSIITRHGGDLEVESRVGEGTTFTIRLPYALVSSRPLKGARTLAGAPTKNGVASDGTPGPRPALSHALKGARILVADDEPGLVAIVRQFMERSGASVAVANGGRSAVEAVQAAGSKFDVVITDLDMPDVDGWAVAAAVKAHQPSTHVVMLTGWAGEIAPEDFRSRGVDVVLGKPCSRAELEGAIGNLLVPKPVSGFDVLLVDDEPAFARAVRDLLALQGHHVTVVDSAAAALTAVEAHTYDVILTDYSLGEVTGAELAETLCDSPDTPFVVLVTGYATEIDDPSLLSRGVNAVLPKPCRGEDLRQILARVSIAPAA